MKLALLVAALAASGGLQGRDLIDTHMREAQKTPERDFRSLIDMARGAVDQVVNAGKMPGERRYVSIEAMYSDRIVIELDGKHWQYAYSLKPVNGVETMVLESPVQVVNQFVAVVTPGATTSAKLAEALRGMEAGEVALVEAQEGCIQVTIIKAGASGNNNYYPDSVLKEAVPMFEGTRVFTKSDAEHIKGGGKDVRNLIGGIYDVKFVEGTGPDTGSLVGTFKALDPKDSVVTKMVEAVRRGMQNLLGLSIDADGKTKKRVQGNKTLREAVKFTKVNSVDLIVEPGAGGGLDRLTEAAAETHQGETTMPLWKQRLLEAIKAKDAAKHATIDAATIGDDDLVKLAEAIGISVVAANADRLTEAQGDNAPVTRAELQLLQLRQTAATRIAASKLPQPAKDRLQADFAGRERFVEADIDSAVKAEGDYLARFTESGTVRVPTFGAGSIQVGDRSVAIKDMLDAFFDPSHANHRDVRSFKECYIEITGDRRVTGLMANVDRSRLAESLGDAYREAIDSSTFADALGNSITRRMQAVFTGLTDLQAWRKVAVVGQANDFRSQERVRIGGYGNLPAVAESGAYAALTSPGDDKATYAVTKRGGTESVTLETIKNDDVRAIRQIPQELALAAANTLYEFVFDFFRTNPNAYDGTAIYHASHNNLFTAALDATAFAAHRLAMVKQTRAGSSKRLGISPKSVLVPFELQETAYNLFVRNQNLDKTYVQSINPEVIPVSYWTDANDWATVCDPMVLPVLEIGFLDGKEDPELFVQDMPNVGSLFSNDKITWKIRHIYGGSDLVDGYKGTTKAVVA
jgi:hypothetical protein